MLFDSTSSSSPDSSTEESIIIPRRITRNRNDPFVIYDDMEFKNRFRFNKGTVMELLHKIGSRIEPKSNRNKAITAKLQILVTLRFFATGGFQMTLGDHVNITKASVSRIISRVSSEVALLKKDFIQMPRSRQERLNVAMGFHNISGIPKVLGAIDCSHIRITSPGGSNAETFRNRKGYFSINVQVVCDARLRIMHIIARWPGSVHDSTIFNDSPLIVELEQGIYGDTYLLGDSGYACKKFLLTPVLNPRTEAERRYNRAQIKARNPIERCFGVLKRRFPCLHFGLRNKIHTTLTIIVACCVLHNYALLQHDDFEELEDLIIPIEDNFVTNEHHNTAVRNSLIADLFERFLYFCNIKQFK